MTFIENIYMGLLLSCHDSKFACRAWDGTELGLHCVLTNCVSSGHKSSSDIKLVLVSKSNCIIIGGLFLSRLLSICTYQYITSSVHLFHLSDILKYLFASVAEQLFSIGCDQWQWWLYIYIRCDGRIIISHMQMQMQFLFDLTRIPMNPT